MRATTFIFFFWVSTVGAELAPFEPILPQTPADPAVINQAFETLRQGVNNAAPTWHLYSSGQKLATAWSIDENHYYTEKGYWFSAEVMVNDAYPSGRLYTLNYYGDRIAYSNSSCAGTPYMLQPRYFRVEEIPVTGFLFADFNGVLYYGINSEAVVVDEWWEWGEWSCVARSSAAALIPLYNNNPQITGWPYYDEVIPNPSIGR